MAQFLQVETLVIVLLLVVSLVAIAVRRLRVPYTVTLVVVGLAITFRQPLQIDLTPELILTLFVPPIIFEAAFHLSFYDLRRNLVNILLLAVPGVVVTTLIVGIIVTLGTQMSLTIALVFGALISATDPTSVIAMFRALRVPKQLHVLVEGESLLNDGTAIVIFNMMLIVALTGNFKLTEGLVNFVLVSLGGTLIGLILGWLFSSLIARIDDYLIETTLTTVLAFSSYLLAERLHFSGVLAVVAAGLINGNIGPQGMSPTTRIVIFNFWENIAFLANSLVFLLIGLDINLFDLAASWQPILWAIAGVLLARVLVVYGLGWLVNRVAEPVPLSWQHVIGWSGLRGAISLALALSLPISIGPERELLRVMTYGVVLFTLLIQSTTMSPLLRWLKIKLLSESQIEYETRHARLVALQAGRKHLVSLHRQGVLSTHTFEKLISNLDQRIATLTENVRAVLMAEPDLEAEELDTARRELLRAQRSALLDLRRDRVISEEVFEKLTSEVDADLVSDRTYVSANENTQAAEATEDVQEE